MLTLKAPAKINWFLKVLDPRSDGYHNIESLIQRITLFDTLSFKPSSDLTLKTDLSIPVEQNLAYKASLLLQQEVGIRKGAEIRLKKNIPVAAGLGGGSSDAASTLLGLNEMWALGLTKDDQCAIAEKLGSDVPFFLHNSLAFVEGRGEIITDHKAEKPVDILIITPSVSISTQWAYKNFKAELNNTKLSKKTADNDDIRQLISYISKADFHKKIPAFNDLEPVALKKFPVIGEIKDKLYKEGAVFSIMSGSGSSVFGVFESSNQAEKASKVFSDCRTEVVQTVAG